ncbi:MAG: hypothetical protein IPK64_11715 [bacterium]|nr:hypothetical protein [bacterium]
MSTATLTSLAMLKVNVDQGRDYLDYLRPFIVQILVNHKPDPVTDWVVRDHLRSEFGLEIPERAVQVVLKRLARCYPLAREAGVYRITGTMADPGIAAKKSKADRHIQAVVSGLMDFSRGAAKQVLTPDDAVSAICAFLTEFNIPCIRAYLRGTAIPTPAVKHGSDVVLVSQYAMQLQGTDPERFESFMVVVQGHMLANALLCPDLHDAPRTYNGVTFYLDTPLLVRRLGLEGESRRVACESLITLVKNLGGTVAAFAHSRDELDGVLRGAAQHVDSTGGRGNIVFEARRKGLTRSDLLLMVGKLDEELANAGIELRDTPRHIEDFQIDETAFEKSLQDEVSYVNPRAREHDINSVRSIYVLRAHTAPTKLEKCKAVLVTSNGGFANAAYEYGQRHEESRAVSSVITDFSLANMAWLKAPMGAPNIPMTEMLAFAYAALRPTPELLDKYATEIDRLEKQGIISARDHQLLRSSTVAQEELMHLTLGDENALTSETITETLRRVTSEISSDADEKLFAEQEAHQNTQAELALQRDRDAGLKRRIYWRCRRRAGSCAWAVSGLLGFFLIVGLLAGIGLQSTNQFWGWVVTCGSGILAVVSLANLVLGTTVRGWHESVRDRCLTWHLKREAATIGIDLESVA